MPPEEVAGMEDEAFVWAAARARFLAEHTKEVFAGAIAELLSAMAKGR